MRILILVLILFCRQANSGAFAESTVSQSAGGSLAITKKAISPLQSAVVYGSISYVGKQLFDSGFLSPIGLIPKNIKKLSPLAYENSLIPTISNHRLIVCNEKVSSLNHLVNSRNDSDKSNYFFNAKNKNNGCDSFSKSIYESEQSKHLANRYLKDK